MAHSQTARTSTPFVDSLRPFFPYLRCVRKGATIPLEVVHAPPGQPFEALAHLAHEHPQKQNPSRVLGHTREGNPKRPPGPQVESNGRAPF